MDDVTPPSQKPKEKLTDEEKMANLRAELARLPEILAEKGRLRLARIEFTERLFGDFARQIKAEREAEKKSGSA